MKVAFLYNFQIVAFVITIICMACNQRDELFINVDKPAETSAFKETNSEKDSIATAKNKQVTTPEPVVPAKENCEHFWKLFSKKK